MRNPNSRIPDFSDFISCPGERYRVLYSPRVLSDGSVDLVESGKDDLQDFIESFRASTDIAFIVQRLAIGDTSVLSSRTPMFGDFISGVPHTYAEALQLVIDGERRFNDLPLDVRNVFNNDFRRWFASAGSDSWLSAMRDYIPASVLDNPVSPVSDNPIHVNPEVSVKE